MVLNQFEKGSKYKIMQSDEDNRLMKYKCTVEAIDSTSIFVRFFEMDGEEIRFVAWVNWRGIVALDKI
ncbi:hypothetical protein IQ781_27450 (plasmid) [Bacillus sp. N447-1]|nr:hypothetical protein IQ781_27450 [Bacillus sp. N447-1]